MRHQCLRSGWYILHIIYNIGPVHKELSSRQMACSWCHGAHLNSGLALRCATSAFSSMHGPRAALTSTASFFISASRCALIRCRVLASRLQCSDTTCGARQVC